MDPVVGIDLGTTYSAVAWVNPDTGSAEILPDPETQARITPSVVLFEDLDNIVVGETAKWNTAHKDRVVELVKRQMGMPKGPPPRGWQFTLGHRHFSAQEVSAIILRKLKLDAEQRLQREVRRAVITAPAYFTEAQRAATAEAGRIAGFEVLAILAEPVAAALAYGLNRIDRDQRVFVFDLGGGTFDVSIVEVRDHEIREIAIDGDARLGGVDWDEALLAHVAVIFAQQFGEDPRDDADSLQDLRQRVVRAKHDLSRLTSTEVAVHHAGRHASVVVTREEFEHLTRGLLERLRACCEDVMEESGKSFSEIDRVLLVGGATRMPMVVDLVRQISGQEPVREMNPDECVALGAAWQATLLQVSSDEKAEREWQRRNPATHRNLQDVRVRRITSHDIGIIAQNPERELRSYRLMKRGTPVPAKTAETFHTIAENQRVIDLTVTEDGLYLEEENCDPATSSILVEGRIEELPDSPRGSEVLVICSFTEDALLEVEALHTLSGRSAKVEVHHPGGLSQEEEALAARHLQRARVTG